MVSGCGGTGTESTCANTGTVIIKARINKINRDKGNRLWCKVTEGIGKSGILTEIVYFAPDQVRGWIGNFESLQFLNSSYT
jgi:hypothetical protein